MFKIVKYSLIVAVCIIFTCSLCVLVVGELYLGSQQALVSCYTETNTTTFVEDCQSSIHSTKVILGVFLSLALVIQIFGLIGIWTDKFWVVFGYGVSMLVIILVTGINYYESWWLSIFYAITITLSFGHAILLKRHRSRHITSYQSSDVKILPAPPTVS